MKKKIAILAILISIFIAGNLFAQSIDVVVHNVLKGVDNVILSKQEIPDGPLTPYGSIPAPGGTGWTTVTFYNVPCSQDHPIWALKAEQGSRSVYESGGFAPFTTVHFYLPTNGIEPDPGEPEPHNQ